MNIFDNDLISIQEARILAENAGSAKRLLSEFSQDRLDKIVIAMLDAVLPHVKELAKDSFEETGYGNMRDKVAKNRFACEALRKSVSDMKCVGFIEEDKNKGTMKVAVPLGTILTFIPPTSPVSTTISNVVSAVKAGNTIIVSPHPRGENVIRKTVDILSEAAYEAGLPYGAVACQKTLSAEGNKELIRHREINFIINTGRPRALESIRRSGKPFVLGGSGDGPCFIERTADLAKAVSDVLDSKTFDNGTVSAAENAVIVERCVESEVRRLFEQKGAYFMNEAEAEALSRYLYKGDGSINLEAIGASAVRLAKRAGFCVGAHVRLLMANGKYNLNENLYTKEKLFPVLAYYIEDDWRNACEKCIELLLFRSGGHTLVIHSRDDYVIRQFALKKPVARVLVNTPASLGSIGVTTNLFPSLTLGSGEVGELLCSENVSPMNLVFTRIVAFGLRDVLSIRREDDGEIHETDDGAERVRLLQELLNEAAKMAFRDRAP